MYHRSGYGIDYNNIVRVFQSYRHEPISEDNWRGFALTSTELSRGINIGTGMSERSMDIAARKQKE